MPARKLVGSMMVAAWSATSKVAKLVLARCGVGTPFGRYTGTRRVRLLILWDSLPNSWIKYRVLGLAYYQRRIPYDWCGLQL